MAESHSKFTLERNGPAVSQSGCTTVHSYQLYVRVPVVPHPSQHFLLSYCFCCYLLCFSHSDSCIVVHCCTFTLHFPDDS